MSPQDVWVEALLNIGASSKAISSLPFEVNGGVKMFTANKKRGERGNAFKIARRVSWMTRSGLFWFVFLTGDIDAGALCWVEI